MQINFVLRGNKEPKVIYISIHNGAERLRLTTKFKVKSTDWNKRTERMRDKVGSLDQIIINEYLDKVETAVMQYYLRCKANNKHLSSDDFAAFVKDLTNPPKNNGSEFVDFVTSWLENIHNHITAKGQPLARHSVLMYRVAAKKVLNFCEYKRIKPSFKDINADFFNDYIQYLQRAGKTTNAIASYVRILKIILNEATAKNINVNLSFKAFKNTTEQAQTIYLTKEEIKKIEALQLDGKHRRLENVRRLFLISYYTGQRYSDAKRINTSMINSDKIRLKQQKTGNNVVIPLHPYIKALLPELDTIKPLTIENMNKRLKNLCRLAGIKDLVTVEKTIGGKRISQTVEKWELCGTHTARRSFATNMYLSGISSQLIMRITGHKSENTFIKYIRISNEESADNIAEIWRREMNF